MDVASWITDVYADAGLESPLNGGNNAPINEDVDMCGPGVGHSNVSNNKTTTTINNSTLIKGKGDVDMSDSAARTATTSTASTATVPASSSSPSTPERGRRVGGAAHLQQLATGATNPTMYNSSTSGNGGSGSGSSSSGSGSGSGGSEKRKPKIKIRVLQRQNISAEDYRANYWPHIRELVVHALAADKSVNKKFGLFQEEVTRTVYKVWASQLSLMLYDDLMDVVVEFLCELRERLLTAAQALGWHQVSVGVSKGNIDRAFAVSFVRESHKYFSAISVICAIFTHLDRLYVKEVLKSELRLKLLDIYKTHLLDPPAVYSVVSAHLQGVHLGFGDCNPRELRTVAKRIYELKPDMARSCEAFFSRYIPCLIPTQPPTAPTSSSTDVCMDDRCTLPSVPPQGVSPAAAAAASGLGGCGGVASECDKGELIVEYGYVRYSNRGFKREIDLMN